MKDHSDCFRGFTHLTGSWYGPRQIATAEYTDQVMIGMYSRHGGATGEFAVRWYSVGGRSVPRIEALGDAWNALGQFQDLLVAMYALDEYPTPVQLIELLMRLGVEDITARNKPEDMKGPTREFFVVVAGHDAPDNRYGEPRGPIAWETYLDAGNTFESAFQHAQRLARSHKWSRVGKLIVEDWPS